MKKSVHNLLSNQKGVAPLLLTIAAAGVIIFIILASTTEFKDKLFSNLFPKPPSKADTTTDFSNSLYKPGKYAAFIGEDGNELVRLDVFGRNRNVTSSPTMKVKLTAPTPPSNLYPEGNATSIANGFDRSKCLGRVDSSRNIYPPGIAYFLDIVQIAKNDPTVTQNDYFKKMDKVTWDNNFKGVYYKAKKIKDVFGAPVSTNETFYIDSIKGDTFDINQAHRTSVNPWDQEYEDQIFQHVPWERTSILPDNQGVYEVSPVFTDKNGNSLSCPAFMEMRIIYGMEFLPVVGPREVWPGKADSELDGIPVVQWTRPLVKDPTKEFAFVPGGAVNDPYPAFYQELAKGKKPRYIFGGGFAIYHGDYPRGYHPFPGVNQVDGRLGTNNDLIGYLTIPSAGVEPGNDFACIEYNIDHFIFNGWKEGSGFARDPEADWSEVPSMQHHIFPVMLKKFENSNCPKVDANKYTHSSNPEFRSEIGPTPKRVVGAVIRETQLNHPEYPVKFTRIDMDTNTKTIDYTFAKPDLNPFSQGDTRNDRGIRILEVIYNYSDGSKSREYDITTTLYDGNPEHDPYKGDLASNPQHKIFNYKLNQLESGRTPLIDLRVINNVSSYAAYKPKTFTAKLRFDNTKLEAVGFEQVDPGQTFINTWIDKRFDNQTGEIFLKGTISEGNISYQEKSMAKIRFRSKASNGVPVGLNGQTQVSFIHETALINAYGFDVLYSEQLIDGGMKDVSVQFAGTGDGPTAPTGEAEFNISVLTPQVRVNEEVRIALQYKANTAANLISAQLKFDPNLLEVVSLGQRKEFPSELNWVDYGYDNAKGIISIVRGANNAGYLFSNTQQFTEITNTIQLKAKASGNARIEFINTGENPSGVYFGANSTVNLLKLPNPATITIAAAQVVIPTVLSCGTTPQANPSSGNAPLSSTLTGDGRITQAPSGTRITRYQWDFDGDGNWDTSMTNGSSVTRSYPTAGNFTPKYRFETSNGVVSNICSYPNPIRVTQASTNVTNCQITEASWQSATDTVTEGTALLMNIAGSAGCENKQVKIEVFESDLLGASLTPAQTSPANVHFAATGTAQITTSWTAEYLDDGLFEGLPEYLFKASIVGENSSRQSANILVRKAGTGGQEAIVDTNFKVQHIAILLYNYNRNSTAAPTMNLVNSDNVINSLDYEALLIILRNKGLIGPN